MGRATIHAMLEGTHPRWGRSVTFAVSLLIVVNAGVITLQSMPTTDRALAALLDLAETVFLFAFLGEFLLRLTCAPRPLGYLFSFWGLIDFLACVPAVLLFVPSLQSLRVIRLLRLFRLVKLLRIGRAYDRLAAAFVGIRHELAVLLVAAVLTLYLSAVGIYLFENQAQPDVFSSIPTALWWAVATLTTVGYGDVYPITAGGRIFTAFVLVIGLGIVALPAGLLTSALMESRRRPAGSDETMNQNNQPSERETP